MTKTDYLSLIRDAYDAEDILGIRQAINTDSSIIALERKELEEALEIKSRHLHDA